MAFLVDILAVGAVDSTGEALDSGKAYIYQIDTNSLATIYNDSEETDVASNPVTLDSAGRAEVYVTGSVRIVVEDSQGNNVDDIANFGGGGEVRLVTSTVDTVENNTVPVFSGTSGVIIAPSTVTLTQLNYIKNVTSDVQAQINTLTSGAITRKITTVFTASGTWTKATYDPTFVDVIVVGAGGGSHGGADTQFFSDADGGAGGGGGGTAIKTILSGSLGTTETVIVGSGGSGSTAGNGGDGGDSSFGSHCTGGGGSGGTSSGLGGAGGTGTNGDINLPGGRGGYGISSDDDTYFYPTNHGGSSYMAPMTPPFSTSGAGRDGANYGGGASGGVSRNSTAQNGGDGADGIVIVLEYY